MTDQMVDAGLVSNARRELAELEEKVREGGDVTIAQLAKARDAAELAVLREEAEKRQALKDAAAKVEAQADEFRSVTLPALVEAHRECVELFDAAVDALQELWPRLEGYRNARAAAATAAARLTRAGADVEVTVPAVPVRDKDVLARVLDECHGRFGRSGTASGGHRVHRHALMSDERHAAYQALVDGRDDRERERQERARLDRRAKMAADAGFDTYEEYAEDRAAKAQAREDLRSRVVW